jgi:short-subunit dehydrogenase
VGEADPPGHGRDVDDAAPAGGAASPKAAWDSANISASVLIPGAIRGAGQGQRMLDEAGVKASRFVASAEAVARAVVKAVKKDRMQLAVMPGQGRLLRAVMDYLPGRGPP